MRFEIEHTTQYHYSQPVFLEPHTLRLRPRCDASQRLLRYQLTVTPEPTGLAEGLDAENNDVALVWYEGLCRHWEVVVSAEIETLRDNPFGGLLAKGADRLPLSLEPQEATSLFCFLAKGDTGGEGVQALTKELLVLTQGSTLDFLAALNRRLFETLEKIDRLETGLQLPQETLDKRKGACRDLAILFMSVCRQVGIPARFVSGYQEGDVDKAYGELHAWAEVYLPGFGWRGYDPTYGLAVADRHIPLAASAWPEQTAPVKGTFRGDDVTATIEHQIMFR